MIATTLTTNQVREAEAIARRLADSGHSLSFYVEFALANYQEPVNRRALNLAAKDYIAAKKHEREQDLISPMHLTRIQCEMKRLQRHFPQATLGELVGPRLREYLELGQVGFKTFNNRRGIVGTFLRFALEREWIAENPLAKIPARRIRRRRRGAATLSAERAREMMAFVEEHHVAAVPFFVLCLFAGIRPCLRSGEILRLRPEHVKRNAGIVRIDGEVSKVREPRRITIQPNLAAWLRAYPVGRYVDPNDPNVMHEAHVVYRKEAGASWNLNPNAPTVVPLGPVIAVADPAKTPDPLPEELEQKMAEQNQLVASLIEQNDALVQQLGKLGWELAEVRRQQEDGR